MRIQENLELGNYRLQVLREKRKIRNREFLKSGKLRVVVGWKALHIIREIDTTK